MLPAFPAGGRESRKHIKGDLKEWNLSHGRAGIKKGKGKKQLPPAHKLDPFSKDTTLYALIEIHSETSSFPRLFSNKERPVMCIFKSGISYEKLYQG